MYDRGNEWKKENWTQKDQTTEVQKGVTLYDPAISWLGQKKKLAKHYFENINISHWNTCTLYAIDFIAVLLGRAFVDSLLRILTVADVVTRIVPALALFVYVALVYTADYKKRIICY